MSFRRPSLIRLLVLVGLAAAAWEGVGWWTGPVRMRSLTLPEETGRQIIGFSSQGDLVRAGIDPADGESATVSLWRGAALQSRELWRRPLPADVEDVGFDLMPGGRWLSITDDRPLQPEGESLRMILDLETRDVHPHDRPGTIWVSSDGRFLMNDDRRTGIAVSELATGRLVGRIDDSWIHDISPNGEWILAGTLFTLQLWRISDNAVAAIEWSSPTPDVAAVNHVAVGSPDSSGIKQPQERVSRFSSDSRRLVLYGENRLSIWQLEPLKELATTAKFSIAAVSADCSTAYLCDGQSMPLTPESLGAIRNNRQEESSVGILLDESSWFLATKESTWTTGRPGGGFSIPLGPYDLMLVPRYLSGDVAYCLRNARTGEEIVLPRWIAEHRSEMISDHLGMTSVPTAFLHPRRLAFLAQDERTVRLIELPPQRPWETQLAATALLLALPGWLLWRRRRTEADNRGGTLRR